MTQFFNNKELSINPPVKRAAYSDRTAWIMAELSDLVYQKLPDEIPITKLVKEIKSIIKEKKLKKNIDDVLEEIIKRNMTGDKAAQSRVQEILSSAGFEYINSYAKKGTEAFLCKLVIKNSGDTMLVVAFRGTQPNITDIVTDLRINLESASGGGRLHKGFDQAFCKVKDLIEHDLKQHSGIPVYMTGHSLGGALAVIATRYLSSDSLGATYTYGCPRIGDYDFFKNIKTPIYRVVNAADGVARVPLGRLFSIFTCILRFIPLNGTKALVDWLEKKLCGYVHHGQLIFLSGAKSIADENGINFKNLKVYQSPSVFITLPIVLKRVLSTFGKAAAKDHSIAEYCGKLYAYAKRRNK